jgi:ParB family transcriptional regulator, chromosome partitioning protein
MQDSSAFQYIAIDQIHESTTNPRQTFEQNKLEELAASIRQHGLIQPITIRPNASGFEIVAGARRFRAAQLAELFSLPARIVDLDVAAAMEWQLIELSIVVKRFLSVFAGLHVVDMSTTCRFAS